MLQPENKTSAVFQRFLALPRHARREPLCCQHLPRAFSPRSSSSAVSLLDDDATTDKHFQYHLGKCLARMLIV